MTLTDISKQVESVDKQIKHIHDDMVSMLGLLTALSIILVPGVAESLKEDEEGGSNGNETVQ